MFQVCTRKELIVSNTSILIYFKYLTTLRYQLKYKTKTHNALKKSYITFLLFQNKGKYQ